MADVRGADVRGMEKVLKALGNRRRLAIVVFLKSRKGRGASVGDIAEAIQLSYKSTSHHLRLLVTAGVLERDQRGPEASFTLASPEDKLVALVVDLL